MAQKKHQEISCPVCNSNTKTNLLLLKEQPLSNLSLYDNLQDALNSKKFDLNIVRCNNCSHIYNSYASISNIDYEKKDNFTFFTSKVWDEYSNNLAKDIIKKYNITKKRVLEIGCGDGRFLNNFYQNNNFCIGYEPSYTKNKNIQFKIIDDYFDPIKDLKKSDVIILRHIVEHFENANEFLKNIINSCIRQNENPLFIIEVPDIQNTLKYNRINDFVYEHISYFSKYSLKYLLNLLHLEIVEVYNAYDDENIIAIAKINQEFTQTLNLSLNSSLNYMVDKLKKDYLNIKSNNANIAIWGAGGRGASFLNLIKNELSKNEIIIDSDKRKANRYVPIVGLKINYKDEFRNNFFDTIIITTSLGLKNILDEIDTLNITYNMIYYISNDGLVQIKEK